MTTTALQRIKEIEKEYECKTICCDNHNSHETSLFLLKSFNVMREIATDKNLLDEYGDIKQESVAVSEIEKEFEERMSE